MNPPTESVSQPKDAPVRSPWARRDVAAAAAAACWAVLAMAAWLEPAAGGMGTHRQLGLPDCSFLVRTGWPCPSCGMTTSLSLTAHGHVIKAFAAQPFGVVLFGALGVLAAAGTAQALTGRRSLARLRPRWMWLWMAVGGMLAGWAIKAMHGYMQGQFPLH